MEEGMVAHTTVTAESTYGRMIPRTAWRFLTRMGPWRNVLPAGILIRQAIRCGCGNKALRRTRIIAAAARNGSTAGILSNRSRNRTPGRNRTWARTNIVQRRRRRTSAAMGTCISHEMRCGPSSRVQLQTSTGARRRYRTSAVDRALAGRAFADKVLADKATLPLSDSMAETPSSRVMKCVLRSRAQPPHAAFRPPARAVPSAHRQPPEAAVVAVAASTLAPAAAGTTGKRFRPLFLGLGPGTNASRDGASGPTF